MSMRLAFLLALSGGVAADMQVVGYPYTQVQKRLPAAQYAASRTYIEQNPKVIEGWVRAYQKGVDWVNQNLKSEELFTIISGYTRMPPPLIARLGVTVYEKAVDPAALEPVVAQMRSNGLLEGAFDPKSILHRTALKA